MQRKVQNSIIQIHKVAKYNAFWGTLEGGLLRLFSEYSYDYKVYDPVSDLLQGFGNNIASQ